jgi:hypothetical protein
MNPINREDSAMRAIRMLMHVFPLSLVSAALEMELLQVKSISQGLFF